MNPYRGRRPLDDPIYSSSAIQVDKKPVGRRLKIVDDRFLLDTAPHHLGAPLNYNSKGAIVSPPPNLLRARLKYLYPHAKFYTSARALNFSFLPLTTASAWKILRSARLFTIFPFFLFLVAFSSCASIFHCFAATRFSCHCQQ
jgi:hypothetical protein